MTTVKTSPLRGIPQINISSCLCCKTQTASLICGYISWIGSMILAGYFMVCLLVISPAVLNRPPQINTSQESLFNLCCVTAICIGLSIVWAKISNTMIVGVKENKTSLIYPYIYATYAGIIFDIVMNFIIFAFNVLPPDMVRSYVLSSIIGAVWGIISLLIVITHYRKLVSMERDGLPVHMANF